MSAPIAVGVCGFGRCGSTMAMRALHAGGVQPVTGTDLHSYELVDAAVLPALAVEDLGGRTIKLLDAVLYDLVPHTDPAEITWRFLWLGRSRMDQARSQVKFLQSVGAIDSAVVPNRQVLSLAHSYALDEPKALKKLNRLGSVVHERYERALADPFKFAQLLANLTGRSDFDIDAAVATVHTRSPACAPDLSFELTGQVP